MAMKKDVIRQSYVVKIGASFFKENSITNGDVLNYGVLSVEEIPNDCVITANVSNAWEFPDDSAACVMADKYGGKVMKKTLSLEDV